MLIAILFVFSCHEEDSIIGTDDTSGSAPDTTAAKVGFEILKFEGLNLSVWVNKDMTMEEFEALDLSIGWIKNEPRESDPDSGYFSRSPFETEDGVFVEEEHFNHLWLYNAHVTDLSVDLPDDAGLLSGRMIEKHHTVIFKAGRTLSILTSPGGDQYVRISRDAHRTQEFPSIPDAWELREELIDEQRTFVLPNPTLNIRADNQDSWQGPISF